MKTLSESRCFGGTQGVYSHTSQVTGCDMTFGLFLPPEGGERGRASGLVPVRPHLHP